MSTPGTLNFPTSLDDSVSLFEAANRASSTLSASLTDVATSLTLVSGALFPSSGAISIDDEIIYYTGKSTNTLTGLIRGRDGTTAAAHTSTTPVKMRVVSSHHEALRDAIIAVQTNIRGTGANENDAAWSATGGTSNGMKFADSTSSSSLNSANPSLVFQTWRSGGTAGVGVHAYSFAMYKTAGAGDTYALNVLLRYTPAVGAFAAGDYNQHGLNVYAIGAPTGTIPGSVNIYVYNWIRSRRDLAGTAVVGLQVDAENYSASNADLDASTVDRTIALATNSAGNKNNSVAWLHQAGAKTTAFSLLHRTTPNSIFGYGFDMKDATYELEGTVATNGTAVTGTGTSFDRQVKKGDQLLINSVWYTVSATPASNTSLTLTSTAGVQAGPLTVVKAVFPLRLAHQANIVARNSAGNADYRFVRLASDVWQMDPDARSVNFGSFISFGTNTLGAPSDTLTTGWRAVDYLASGFYVGRGVESGYGWSIGNGLKFYVGPSSAPVLALTIESTAISTFGGDIALSGLARRFTANMTDGTLSNRFAFQNSQPNSAGILSVLPSGSSTTGSLRAFNNSDPAAAAFAALSVTTTAVVVTSSKNAGSFLPLRLEAGGINAVEVSPLGSVMVGSTALATTATDGFFHIPTCAGTPTGTPTDFSDTVPMIYDTSANKLWIYNGAWRSVTLA